MKEYLKHDEWCIIEEGLKPEYNEISESIFSIGNGRLGQRANFEEAYSGPTFQGSYLAGVYYPDKTKVGWWKNGYPEYFAKVLNAPNWIGIDIQIDGEQLDLAKCEVSNFRRVLNMKEGYLERSFNAKLVNGTEIEVNAKRFCSIVADETAAIRYAIKLLNYDAKLSIKPYVDGDIINKDTNYDEKFWVPINEEIEDTEAYVTVETKKTAFQVTTGMLYQIEQDGKQLELQPYNTKREKYADSTVEVEAKEGQETVI
ncbi:MAG: hypothetical protein MRY78_17115, partial [Saprospiraceae bacterium]|nr:hypothetical protein [Saprospiraceae bacterium]